ncbi:hypothetical protein LSAT2_025536 [Lamellibrachia satsuma]|nr:hypothetical protein LSAT2_025536 [Lamellibrachia satsuma]
MTALLHLSLNGCKLSGEGAETVAFALRQLLQLTKLSFDNNNLSDPTTGQILADSVSKMTSLRTLSLNGCQLSDAGTNALSYALHHLPQLVRLRLDGNPFCDPTTCQALAGNVSKMTALRTLSLSSCQLSGAEAKALAFALRHLPQLEELSLCQNNLNGQTTGQTFIDSVSQMTDLRALSLDRCELSGTTIKALVVALSHMPRFTKLSLNSNNCGDPTTSQTLVDIVSKMTGLQLLSLQYCGIRAEALTTLLDNLCHLTSLKELNLSHIGTVAAQQLCRSLSQLSQLEKLRLEKCHINRTSEHAIKRVANSLPRLKFFRLY